MTAGTHGSTFGGNPLATAVGNAVLDVMLEPGFLEACRRRRCASSRRWPAVKDEIPDVVEEVRGAACSTGIKVKPPLGDVVKACAAEKLLTVGAGDNVVRLLPPLNVTDAELRRGSLSRALIAGPRNLKPCPRSRPECHGREQGRAAAPAFSRSRSRSRPRRCARILGMAHAMKRAGKRVPAMFKPEGIADRRWS